MAEDQIEVKLLISEADIDDERLDQSISRLIIDLRDQDERLSVRRLEKEDIPEAAMGGSFDWRGLLLTALPSKIVQLLDAVIEKFQRNKVTIVISIEGIKYSVQLPLSPEEIQVLQKDVKEITEKVVKTKNSRKK